MPSTELAQAVAVTAELTGTELSKVAIQVMLDDLSRYPEQQVFGALTRCRREIKGRLTIADVISRLDDGRPGVEEAWALAPKDEATTVVWTEEMAQAMSGARGLLADGDAVGARMAFKETYGKLCQAARDRQTPVSWNVSMGWDKQGRETAILDAVRLGRLPASRAKAFLPNIDELVALPAPDKNGVRPAIRSLAEKMMFNGAI